MLKPYLLCLALFLFTSLTLSALRVNAQGEPPTDWIDADTGHRVVRLSTKAGTESFYFHQVSFTADGDKLLTTTGATGAKSNRGTGLATIDITKLGKGSTPNVSILEDTCDTPVLGPKTRTIYYIKNRALWGTHVDTKESREVAKLPMGYSGASGLAISADELLVGSTGGDQGEPVPPADGVKLPTPTQWATAEGKSSQKALFTVNVKTGAITRVYTSKDNLNHTQFSPTDPKQILFAHEGTWDLVDRIWTIRADGTGLKRLHERTMAREIAGHEFFGSDGKWVWYDLQTPRSTNFSVAGVNLTTGERIRYTLTKNQWSVHFNQSHDGKHFAGDGGGPSSVAKGNNGQWIHLFTPPANLETIKVGADDIKTGKFEAERLVNLSKHDYTLEPCVMFTPDDQWIVFRSNMHGAIHTYAVEVKKTAGKN